MTTWRIEADDEWTSRDPYGVVKQGDRSERADSVVRDGVLQLAYARNGYASCRLQIAGAGSYRLSVELPQPMQVDLFRAWYHRPADDGAWFADALVPVAPDAAQQLPEPDNAVPGQTHQEFWLDVFIPRDAEAGSYAGRIVLQGDDERIELPVALRVDEAVLNDENAVCCNHHSFGCRWLWDQYPARFDELRDRSDRDELWRQTIRGLHDCYRICYEHRGLFSNRGVGHANTFEPIYGPTLVGQGREKRIDDWTLFDEHYGPLCEGTAFAEAAPGSPPPRRPADPIWCVATPFNAEWPADYLYWGQPGYEEEFVRCTQQYDAHLREKGWTQTHPYFFFVHKKRYRWLEWDGDEPKYSKDDAYWAEFGRLMDRAVGDSPIPWIIRMDASWQMKNEFSSLEGVVDWWVCGGFLKWYPEEVDRVIERGDMLWQYSGLPAIGKASASILEQLWRPFARGIGGNIEWKAFASGKDPWFASDGNATQLWYPGERFGIPGPIPSLRMKVQRNGVQDVTLLRDRADGRELTAELIERLPIWLYQTPPRAVHELPPEDWDSRNLSGSQDDQMSETIEADPQWWREVRGAALDGAREGALS